MLISDDFYFYPRGAQGFARELCRQYSIASRAAASGIGQQVDVEPAQHLKDGLARTGSGAMTAHGDGRELGVARDQRFFQQRLRSCPTGSHHQMRGEGFIRNC